MNDIIALKFHISLNATTWIGRIGMVVLPPFVYFITYRWCIGHPHTYSNGSPVTLTIAPQRHLYGPPHRREEPQ